MAVRASLALLLVILFAAAPVAHASSRGPVAAAAPPPVLRIGFLQAYQINPYNAVTEAAFVLLGLLYDNPFTFDQDGNRVANLITSSGCATADCSVWNYTVRQGVYWNDPANPSNHPELTAADVNFTWNYDSQHLAQLWAYDPYFDQVVQCTTSNVGRCGAVRSTTNLWNVTLYFDRPFVAGNDLMAPIVNAAQWSAISPSMAGTSYNNADPIGTGPFIADPNIYNELLSMPSVPLHLTRNPSYHPIGSATPTTNITDLYLYEFTDPTTMATALQGGSLDLAQFTASTIGPLQGVPNVLVQTALQSIQEWNYVGFSQCDTSAADSALNPARWDSNVRQALARATNKDAIVQDIYHGLGQRGSTLVSPITPEWWYDPVAGGDNLTYSLAQAASLLDADGWTGTWSDTTGTYRLNPNPITLSIQSSSGAFAVENITNTTKTIPAGTHLQFTLAVRPPATFPEEYATAQYLQAQWAQIGVKIVIKAETTEGALSNDVYACKVEAYIWFWSGDPDPNYILSMQSSWTLNGWNDNDWVNTSYNRLYLQQLSDLGSTQRAADVRAAEKLQYDAAPDLIYIYPYGDWAMRTDLWQGWGDWAAHPYRQMNVYWGANPLFFDLSCASCIPGVMNQPPTIPQIEYPAYSTWYAKENLTLTAQTSDPESTDGLNWTWSWGDGNTTTTYGTAAAPTSTATHAWSIPGNYSVNVTVTDGWNPPIASLPIHVNVIPKPALGWIAGVVQNVAGVPIAGATVTLTPTDVTSGVTGSDGRYNITVGAGTYAATARAPLYVNWTVSGVTVAANVTTVVNFSLFPPDSTPPTTAASLNGQRGNAPWYIGPVTVTLTATDTVSGVASTGYRIDGGAWQTYTAPFVVQAQGNHTVDYRSLDRAGNVEPTHTAAIPIDGLAPAVSVQAPANGSVVSSSSVELRWAASDSGSGLNSVLVSVDGGAFSPAAGSSLTLLGLADGAHTVTFRATDVAGNVATASVSFTVQTGILGMSAVALGGLVAVVFAVAAVAAFLWHRRRKAMPPGSVPPGPPPR